MPRKRMNVKTKHPSIPVTALFCASDGRWADESEIDELDRMTYAYPTVDICREACLIVWRAIREEFIVEYAETYPGRRPSYWWIFDAPTQRERLGGTGLTEWQKYRS